MKLFRSRNEAPTTADADQARDSGNWLKAKEGYEVYLAAFPSRHDIWVQLGHARKELGDLAGAEAAYRQSLSLNAKVADTHLQLGHLLKILQRHDEAIEAYSHATELDPSLGAAWRELRAFGVEVREPIAASRPRILIDLSDVFFYVRHHSTVSGIQRVQLGLARALMQLSPENAEVVFLTELDDHSSYVEVEPKYIQALLRNLSKTKVELKDLQTLAHRAAAEGLPYTPIRGDFLLVLGAFWVQPNIIGRVVTLKGKGVRVGVMFHDIIPITHPEYCEKALTDTFNLYIRSVLKIVDLIISISEHTQSEVRKLLEKEQIPEPAMFVLRNAHTSWEAQRRTSLAVPSSDVAEVLQTKYVLYVSTIEIRKNHTLLFRVWKKLLEEMGDAVPRLVFVGRPGWRVRDLMDQIVGTDYLNGSISILHDIPDTDLELLYRNAHFTTFPSFEEGWGLPVGESLVFGRPCVASDASSIPEVGGDFVDYIDPYNLDDALNVFRRMIQDEQYLRQRAEAIASGFQVRTWENVAQELLDQIAKQVSASPSEEAKHDISLVPTLAPGRIHIVGHRDNASNYINVGLGPIVHFLFDSHWYPVENFGRWMTGGRGGLSFCVPALSQGLVRVVMTVCTTGWYDKWPVQIVASGKTLKTFEPQTGARTTVAFDADASSGKVTIGIYVRGKVQPGPDPRKDLCVGLVSLGYAGINDVSARLSLLEQMVFARSQVVELNQHAGKLSE